MKIDTSIPWILDEFTLESNLDLGKIDASNITLYLSEAQKTGLIMGENLLKKLENKKPLSSAVLRYLLDNPELIPEEWKNKYVYFFGTILRSPDGKRCVLDLCWDDGEWHWHCCWLGDGWYSNCPSAVLASPELSKSSDTLH